MDFSQSMKPTVGMEIELQLLDEHSLDLMAGIMPLMEFFPDNSAVKPELIQSCVEINSVICRNSAEATQGILHTLVKVRRRCDELGMRMCGAGTHAFGKKLGLITRQPRFIDMKSNFGLVSRNQQTFATHVHIGMPSGNMAMFAMRHLIPCMPVLLAISANSPFWRGYHTAHASYRHRILAAAPNYGLPPYFEDWGDFVRFFQMAQRADVFSTFKDIHWDIRPHPDFGTLELRVMDAASTVGTAGAIAAFARSLVVYLIEHASVDLAEWPVIRLPRWIEEINCFQASNRGLGANYISNEKGEVRPLRDLVSELIDLVKPVAQRIGEARGISALESFLTEGAGYQRQLQEFERSESYFKTTESLADLLDREIGEALGANSAH